MTPRPGQDIVGARNSSKEADVGPCAQLPGVLYFSIVKNWKDDAGTLSWYYEHNLEVARIFFDWRYKLLSLGLGVASALVAVSATLRGSHRVEDITAAMPALLGVVIALAVALVNERFADVLRSTYKIGAELEGIPGSWWAETKASGPFTVLHRAHQEGQSRSVWQYFSVSSFTGVINTLAMLIAAISAATAGLTLAGR
jgi:hypothetical protein